MKKQVCAVIVALSVALSATPVLAESAVKVGTAEFKLSADVSVQASQLAAFEELKALFTATTVDLAKVKDTYNAKLQAQVKARNAEIDNYISTMISGGISGGYSANQVKQAVDKGLQWFFYEEITVHTKTDAAASLKKGDKAAAKASLEKAIQLYGGSVGVTAGKRDEDYKTLTQDVLNKVAIPGMIAAVDAGSEAEYQVYRQIFDKTIIKVFLMGTVKYAGKVEASLAAGKKDDAAVQLTEGFFFFMPIYNSMSGGSKSAAEAIKNAYSAEGGAKLSSEAVKLQFAETINAKINGYLTRTFEDALPKKDVAKALEMTSEANSFISSLEIIIKEKLGAEAYASLEKYTQAYFTGVKEGKVEEAKNNAYEALKLISQLGGVQFKVGDKTLNVKGKAVVNEEEVAYLDATSGRTLVAVRFIGEALGAKVEFDEATQSVSVMKGGKTVKLTVNDKAVYIDGKKAETVLDQPLVITNNRAYIPIRAVAEALGQKVFWHNGSIIIN